jgi:hypothetical protein
MARLLFAAAAVGLLASSASAAVLVVRSSGPSAAAYPPGKALPDTHVLKLKATDTVILLDSRGTRTLSGPGSFSVSASAAPATATRTAGASARRVRLGAVRGTGGTRSVWQADLGRSGNVCIANPGELTLYRPDAAGPADITLTDSDGKSAKVHFESNQWEASWPAELEVKAGKRVNIAGLAQPATLTLRQLSPVPTGLEGMAQSLIRADCQAQLDVLIDTFSTRSDG